MHERRLTDEEKRDWLKGGQVRHGPHRFAGRVCHWPYCTRCGLLLLKNEATRKAAAKPCEWEE